MVKWTYFQSDCKFVHFLYLRSDTDLKTAYGKFIFWKSIRKFGI